MKTKLTPAQKAVLRLFARTGAVGAAEARAARPRWRRPMLVLVQIGLVEVLGGGRYALTKAGSSRMTEVVG
jgi:hypothetical protein